LGALENKSLRLSFSSEGDAPILLNGFGLMEETVVHQFSFTNAPWHSAPQLSSLPEANGHLIKYKDISNFYGISFTEPMEKPHELRWNELGSAFGGPPSIDMQGRIADDPDALFIHLATKLFTVPGNSSYKIYGLVCSGTREQVEDSLRSFSYSTAEDILTAAREDTFQPVASPAGVSYQFSQRLMSSVTLSNLTYPIYTQRSYIRHYSPGRKWDSLYTWDSGFLGMGLLEIDPKNAIEVLNTYVTSPGAQSAFLEHGTPIATQIFLFGELWNRTQSQEMLEYFYPRLRQFYSFLAGRYGSSTTRKHQERLVCTWDYFYSTGGWDDYPPQKFVHEQNITAFVAPVVSSAYLIRCAKILSQAAAALEQRSDIDEYDQDIDELSSALQKYSWDAESGYFGYVVHNKDGVPTGILRDVHGVNFNMGLDGVCPLVAGICSRDQEDAILAKLFSPHHLWDGIGITTVDRKASYYSNHGYWNGRIWMAHQWFLWKTMLDLGRADLALKIAKAGLNIWKTVTDLTYDCCEFFRPSSPFGEGWHQFSSLSSPVLVWFSSLYTPGRLTFGFNVWLHRCKFEENNRFLEAAFKTTGYDLSRKFSILACMNPGSRYRVTWNGEEVASERIHDGLLQIQLPYFPTNANVGTLHIVPVS